MIMKVYINHKGARGGVVVKALRYKPAGRGFDSHLSALTRAETVSSTLGFGASRSLPLTGPTSPFSFGLYRLFAPGQVEAIPPSPQAPGYWQVFGCHRLDEAMM
jgi:hypothetical protein